jgi:glycosyltransferase involved in cell wall biosynthesis
MRLLITTQAVDLDDPVLAFFHRWIEEFAKKADHIEVICLKEGRHNLPKNVSVHSLEKEKGESNLKYIWLFYKYAWGRRHNYDAVFVHMNPEYLVIFGWLWKLLGKKTGLWYIHPRSSWRLQIARVFVDKIFSATAQSFPLKSSKLVAVGHGVDTDFFASAVRLPSETMRIMCSARIAPVKNVECMIDAMTHLAQRKVHASFDYYGDELPRDEEYAKNIRQHAAAITAWTFKGRASPEEIRDAYQIHDVHVNATVSGSFDKAVFEAMACGCISVASNTALRGILPDEVFFEESNAESLANALERIAQMPLKEREVLSVRLRKIAEERYSLSVLIGRVVGALA